MTWFTENPLPIVLVGVIVEAMLAIVLARTGKRSVLWSMIGLAAFVAGAVVLERYIVTPREEVRTALEEIRTIVVANDLPKLLERIDTNQEVARLRTQVQQQLANHTVTEAKINELKNDDIQVQGDRAQVKFFGSVDLKFAGQVAPTHFPLKFDVRLRKKDGVWIVTEATYSDPIQGLRLGG